MRLHLVLAATLAAFFVVGCSTEKSTSPKASASVEPQDKPVQSSHEAVSAPPPKADPPLRRRPRCPQKTKTLPRTGHPPAPPDPLAGIVVERRHYYEQVADLLVPVVKAGGAVAQAAFQPRLSEIERRMIAVAQLGEYRFAQQGGRDNAACYFGQDQRHRD